MNVLRSGLPRAATLLALVLAAAVSTWLLATRFVHEERAHVASGTHAHVHPVAQTKRAALTPAEEQYIRALWPIHADVQRNVMRLSLGQIFYKSQDLDRTELNTRVDQALAAYRDADVRLRAIAPPESLRPDHAEYLAAVRLFEESAVELQKMFTDGREDHMLAAYPKSQRGSDKIREVGGKFWPNEFPPH